MTNFTGQDNNWYLRIKRFIQGVSAAVQSVFDTSPECKKVTGEKYQVFISCKSKDKRLGKKVYSSLIKLNLSVFFSPVTLEQEGTSEFMRDIDKALEEASVMVVVGKSKNNLEARWVQHEWHIFQAEKLSGQKPEGEIFTYVKGLESKDLPAGLLNYQMFHDNKKELIQLGNYISKALGSEKSSNEEEPPKVPIYQRRLFFRILFIGLFLVMLGITVWSAPGIFINQTPTPNTMLTSITFTETAQYLELLHLTQTQAAINAIPTSTETSTQTLTPSATANLTPSITPTITSTSTPTFTSTSTSTRTRTPSKTLSPTPTVVPGTFSENCIPKPWESPTLLVNKNCIDLSLTGITAYSRELVISANPQSQPEGKTEQIELSLPISTHKRIKSISFQLNVINAKESDSDQKETTFLYFGVAPRVLNIRATGNYIFFDKRYAHSYLDISYLTYQAPEYDENRVRDSFLSLDIATNIEFTFDTKSFSISRDGEKEYLKKNNNVDFSWYLMKDPVFIIGYAVRPGGVLDVKISDFTIQY